jgi:hypothetical protein
LWPNMPSVQRRDGSNGEAKAAGTREACRQRGMRFDAA